MRSWRSTLLAVAVCALTAPGYGVVIGNWESGLDGWEASDPSVSLSLDPTWHTLGAQSLRVNVSADPWDTVRIANQPAILPLVLANNTFSIDSLTKQGDLAGDLGLHLIIGAGATDGTQIWDDYGYRWAGNGQLDFSTTSTWVYDPSRLQNVVNHGLVWWQLMIITNNTFAPMAMNLDNAQLTPEPASLTLLALAGLLMRRRR